MIDYKDFRNFAVKERGLSGMRTDEFVDRNVTNYITPAVIEERRMQGVAIDIFSRMMLDRILFLGDPITGDVPNFITAQLLYLESVDPSSDIMLYINSPGGSVYGGLAMYDTMQYIGPDINTVCLGVAASMSAILLCAGVKGKRTALPHSRIMIHQPMGGVGGQASDIEITANEIIKLKTELTEIISKHSGQDYKKVEENSDRDYWMTATEAKEFGMVDEVLQRKPKDED